MKGGRLVLSRHMTQAANLWTIVLGVAGLLVMFAIIGFCVALFRRSRGASGSAGVSEKPVSEADAAFLDSSHIGLEPFVEGEPAPRYDAKTPVRKGYAKHRPQ